jgi:hypothetical protein
VLTAQKGITSEALSTYHSASSRDTIQQLLGIYSYFDA